MNPILHEMGVVFIPASNIEKAIDWYCDLLGIPATGHYMIPLKGTNIVLDSKIYSLDSIFPIPAFHLNTDNIQESYEYIKSKNVELITEIESNHWFNFKDPKRQSFDDLSMIKGV